MRELFINNQAVDLFPDGNIALTKQCNKLNELKDRQADYSNQFTIPATANNKKICGFPNVVGSYSINPYTKLAATYIENGSELISNGVAIIEEFNGGINITLYSGIFDFFNTLGEKTLRDLDLSDSDHTFNLAGVLAGNTSDKYVYPLIQWGQTDKNNNIVDIRYQMPAVKVPYLIDKIFEAAQYQKGGNVFEFDSYSKLIIPVVEDSLIDEEAVLLANSFKAHTENPYVPAVSSYTTTARQIEMNYFGTGDAYNSTAGLYKPKYAPSTDYRYTAATKVTVNIDLRLFVSTLSGSTRVVVAKNRVIGANGVLALGTSIYDNSGLYTLEIENVSMNPGDYIEIFVFHPAVQTFTIYPTGALQGDPAQFSYVSITAVNTIELGQNISLTNLVPELKQRDLIKDLMIAYCLVPQVDSLTRTVNFVQFDTIGDNALQGKTNPDTNNLFTVNWSNKLHLKSGYKVRYRFDEYAKTNYMKWAQNDDRDEVGKGAILIDDETLPEQTDLFVTTLAGSIQELDFKGNTGVNIKRYTRVAADEYSNTRSYSEGDYALFNGLVYEAGSDVTGTAPPSSPWVVLAIQYEKTESVEPRLLLIRDYTNNGSPPSSSLSYTDGSTTQVFTNAKIAYFVDPLQNYDLSFEFIISEHYGTLVRVLNKTKIVDAYFKLSDSDFKNIDFFKPVYISYFGNYFYINQGKNYISGRLTSVELVRL